MSNTKNIGLVICENIYEPRDIKVVDSKNSLRITAEGILQDVDKTNRNGRWYDAEDLIPAVNDKRQQELIASGNMYGEDGHPLEKDIGRQAIVDPPCRCVLYRKIWVDGKYIKAQFHGSYNANGAAFDLELRNGCLPSFSLRALGNIQQENGKNKVKNIKIITWDRVIYPSHDCAYTTKIIGESTDLMNEHVTDSGIIIPITNEKVMDYIKTESANIKSIINQFDTLYNSITLTEDGKFVKMVSRDGAVMAIRLEQYIQNDIMDFCSRR